FASGPTRAYAAVKAAIGRGWDATLEQGLEIEAEEFSGVFDTEDARIGVAAFLAKERPDFVGH
ncbi:MAG: enoyl-CoA hydratase/isomerase family protein, partial [Actinomycetota bacterium]|nr:enoyl-CoA hydratase/isomerase family protein [Actinomycetota bacterium]